MLSRQAYLALLAPLPLMPDTDPSGPAEDGVDGLLKEHSVLSREEYLDLQRAIGTETRFRILNLLTEHGAHSAKELEEELEVPPNTLQYHLDTLIEGGSSRTANARNPAPTAPTPTTGPPPLVKGYSTTVFVS